MNWAMPRAPAGETARGLNPDSAISWAASSPGETFHRDAECSSGARYGAGTNPGSAVALAWPASSPSGPTRLPASEQGGGPPTNPKCHGSQEYHPLFINGLTLPALRVAA